MELASKSFPEVECKWGDVGIDEIIKDSSVVGVAVVLAGQIQVFLSLSSFVGILSLFFLCCPDDEIILVVYRS